MTTPVNGQGDARDVIRRSVTADDYNDSPRAGVFHFNFPALGSADTDLPPFWSFQRDYVLQSTLYRESMWADAVSIAISKIAARGFDVDSEIPLRARRAQDLFLGFDSGRGYVAGLQKHLQNFLLTGNGGHVEIVRATPALGSRILGLVPLDTLRCQRTGDPDYPIIYRDRMGREHVMREWDVFSLADMPDPADTWYGVGHCAAERAYKAICKLENIERYISEKVGGQRILSFYIVGGVNPDNLEQAKRAAMADTQAKGITTYMGAAIVAMMGDTPATVVEIPLAELPDGFNRKEEWDITITTYARALGIAVQDLQPLSGQGLGTGTQSVVLDEAAKGQGLAVWSQQWEHMVNRYALDDKTTYAIRTYDIRDREREAKVRIDEAVAIETWTRMGLTDAQAINLGVDRDQLPPEYRVEGQDLTPGEQLSDDEKPEQVEAETDAEQPQPEQAPAAEAPEAGDVRQVAEAVEKAARALHDVAQQQARAEKARSDATDAELLSVVKELVELARVEEPPVAAPVVNVAPPVVHVAPPQVTVKAPDVHVPAPVVNVPAPVVNVAAPAQKARGAGEYEVVERDAQGRVKRWRERTE